jgi:hypothetical protein
MSAAPPRISQPTTSLAAGARAPEIESWGRKVVSRNVWSLSRVERFRLYSYLLVRFIGSHLYLLKPVRSISNTITAANCTNEGGTVSKLFHARLQQGRRNWNAWVAAKEDDRKVSSMGMQLFGRHLRRSHGRAQYCLAIATASQLVSFEQSTPDSTCGSYLTMLWYRKRA